MDWKNILCIHTLCISWQCHWLLLILGHLLPGSPWSWHQWFQMKCFEIYLIIFFRKFISFPGCIVTQRLRWSLGGRVELLEMRKKVASQLEPKILHVACLSIEDLSLATMVLLKIGRGVLWFTTQHQSFKNLEQKWLKNRSNLIKKGFIWSLTQ